MIRGAGDEGRIARIAAWLVPIAVVCVALHFRQLFLGKTFVLRDQLVYTWTERKVLADALRAGRIPEWNDLIGLGTQFAASSANGVTYPPLWVVALFPLPFSMDLVAVLHVLLAGIGVALFARRLGADRAGAVLAAAAFMTCGYVASTASNKIFTGIAWIPWVAWGADGVARAEGRTAQVRTAAVFAAVLAAQFLAGDPASSITSGILAVIVISSRAARRLPAFGRGAASYGAALLLGAAGVLPGLALLPHTARAALSPGEAMTWSLHPWRLFELVWPGFLGNPLDPALNLAELVANSGAGELDPGWSLSLYVGAPILALAILAMLRGTPGARGLWVGAASLTVLALGAYTPLYAVFRAIFPPARIVRYPEKHVAAALCILCALAGAAVPLLGAKTQVARRIFAVSVGSVATLIAAAALLRGVLTERLRATSALMAPPLELDATFAHALGSGMVSLVVAVVVSGLFLRSAHSRWGRIAVPCAIAIYALHSGWEAWTITPVAPAHQFTEVPGLLRRAAAAAATDRPPPRVYRSPVIDAEILPDARPTYSHQTLYLDSAGRFGFAAVPGFEGWRSPGFAALRSRAAAMSLDSFLTLYAIDYVALPSEVRQELFPVGGRPQGTISELELGFAAARPEGTVAWSLIPVERTRPRAFVAPRWRWASAGGALDDALRPDRAEDAGLVVLEGDGAAGGAAGRLTPCALAGYRPEKVDLECDSGGGYAVVAGENAPGWSATVDGAAAPIITADVLLRAVRVERGRHRVRFSYRTPLLRTGVAVSAIAWLAWFAVLRRTRRAATAPVSARE